MVEVVVASVVVGSSTAVLMKVIFIVSNRRFSNK